MRTERAASTAAGVRTEGRVRLATDGVCVARCTGHASASALRASVAFTLRQTHLRRKRGPSRVPIPQSPTALVHELAFRDGIMDRIRLRERRFHERAYLFVLAALEFRQQGLTERRHLSGRELAESVRDLALERFGVTARMVLDHWGVRSSADIGDVVFTMVETGLLMALPSDTRDDFVDVVDFGHVFDTAYPWTSDVHA